MSKYPFLILITYLMTTVCPVSVEAADRDWDKFERPVFAKAKRDKRIILAYFSGSDWCAWCNKLEKDVLDTEMFERWSRQNLILFNVDFPANTPQGAVLKKQNAELKRRYNVTKTPTLLFLNHQGQVLARLDYEGAKLREKEPPGKPFTFMDFCKNLVKNPPEPESVKTINGFIAGKKYADDHDLPLLLILKKDNSKPVNERVGQLLANPDFIRFANTTLAVAEETHPTEGGADPKSIFVKSFMEKHNLPPATILLALYDPKTDKVVHKVPTFSANNIPPIIKQLNQKLPPIPYDNSWLNDYRKALAIANQTKKMVFIYFTKGEESEYCVKMDEEILSSEEFKSYAAEHFVLVKFNYSSKGMADQSPELREELKEYANQYQIRGYPTVLVLNNKAQKAATAKYQKGGPGPFMQQMKQVRARDLQRFNRVSDW